MAKCKCKNNARIVSNTVRSINNSGCCKDVCTTPLCGDPNVLGAYVPVVYDAIGINLCTTFETDEDIADEYPTVTSASVKVLDVSYTYGDDNVVIEAISNRPNCYRVTLSNLTVQFALNLYDCCNRLVDTIYPETVYLPPSVDAPTYDEDTNPTAVEMDIYAPYGLSYDTESDTPTPVLGFIGFNSENSGISQGITMSAMAKLLNFSTDENEVTVGLTLFIQSIYYAAYNLATSGKIDIPKGSIIAPEDSDCMRFVAGDLLNLAIKPLELGAPLYEENLKQECCGTQSCGCGNCNSCGNSCSNSNTDDDTVIISGERNTAINAEA